MLSQEGIRIARGRPEKAAQAVAGRDTNITGSLGTEEMTRTVVSLPVASRVVPEEEPGSKFTWNQAQETEKRDGESSIGTSQKEQYLTVREDILEKLHKEVDIVHSLQSELDATRVAMRAAEAGNVTKLVEVENELVSVIGKWDTAMGELSAHKLREKSSMTRISSLRKANTELVYRKAKMEQDLRVMGAELENLKKSEQTHARDLEEAKYAFETVRQILLEDVTAAVKKTIALEENIVSMAAEQNASLETSMKNIEQEKEKTLCSICMERQ